MKEKVGIKMGWPPGWLSWQHAAQTPPKSWWSECILSMEWEWFIKHLLFMSLTSKYTVTLATSISPQGSAFAISCQENNEKNFWLTVRPSTCCTPHVYCRYEYLHVSTLCTQTAQHTNRHKPCLRSHLTAQPRTSCSSLPSSTGSECSATRARSGRGKSEISWAKIWQNTARDKAFNVSETTDFKSSMCQKKWLHSKTFGEQNISAVLIQPNRQKQYWALVLPCILDVCVPVLSCLFCSQPHPVTWGFTLCSRCMLQLPQAHN